MFSIHEPHESAQAPQGSESVHRVKIKVESVHLGSDPGDWVVVEGETTPVFARHKLVRALVPVREARRAAMRLARGARTATLTIVEDRILSVQTVDMDDVDAEPVLEPSPDPSSGGGTGHRRPTGDSPWEDTPAFEDGLQEW
jgi:hypothetical protein